MLDPPKKIYARTPTSNPTKIIIKLKHFTGKKAKKKKKSIQLSSSSSEYHSVKLLFLPTEKGMSKNQHASS